MADEIEIDLNIGAQVFPDESVEDAVARIVAAEPNRHRLSLEDRQTRAKLLATSLAHEMELHPDDYEQRYAARVRECGGDPDEMMVGNKPRWTMDEDTGDVKDHDTERVYPAKVVVSCEPDSTIAQNLQASYPDKEFDFNTKDFGAIAIDTIELAEGPAHPVWGAVVDEATSPARAEPPAIIGPGLALCDPHDYPDDAVDDTPCRLCGLTFFEWANS